MEIKPTYATFEQAKKFKEKGFDARCQNTISLQAEGEVRNSHQNEYIDWNNFIPSTNPSLGKCYISCPEQWQVVEWLRLTHGIWISPYMASSISWGFHVLRVSDGHVIGRNEGLVNSPQEAYSAAFDYILNNLI
jgi:hypothetical protein